MVGDAEAAAAAQARSSRCAAARRPIARSSGSAFAASVGRIRADAFTTGMGATPGSCGAITIAASILQAARPSARAIRARCGTTRTPRPALAAIAPRSISREERRSPEARTPLADAEARGNGRRHARRAAVDRDARG